MVVAVGGCYLAVTVAVWLGLGAGQAPRGSALLWFPASLLPQEVVPLGWADDGVGVSFAIGDFLGLFGHLLLCSAALGIGYVRAARRAHLRRPAAPDQTERSAG